MTNEPANHRMIRTRLAATIAVFSLLAAACGSDDDTSDDASAPAATLAESTDDSADDTSTDADVTDEPATSAPTDEPASNDTADQAEEPADDDISTETRTVQTSFGEFDIPANPERIVALDAVAAMNMISLGIEPTTVFDINGAAVVRNVLTERGIELRSDLGDGFSEFNYEAVAAEEPDLLVIVAVEGFEQLTDPLQEIAPTIVMPFFGTWQDSIRDTGALFDRQAEADAVIAGIEQRFDDVTSTVQNDPFSLSIIAAGLGFLLAMSPDAAISITADQVGITRPDAQTGDIEPFMGQPAFQVSEELLTDHDADVIAVLDGQFYDSALVRDIPTFDSLSATQSGNVFNVDGDMWFTGNAFAVFWQLADLEAIASDNSETRIGTVEDSLQRWDDYLTITTP